jgi:xanthine phosphoribosyltransferase
MRKVRLGNKTLTEALYAIGRRASQYDVDCVVAIERGGLPLAVFLSAFLTIPLERIKVSFYKDTEKQDKPIVDLRRFDSSSYKKPIFVDDLVDTGDTLKYIKEAFGNAPYATIYAGDTIQPDIYFLHKNTDEWIIFPWDTEDDGFDNKFTELGWWDRLDT